MARYTYRLNVSLTTRGRERDPEALRPITDRLDEALEDVFLELAEAGTLPRTLRNYSITARLVQHRT